MHDMELDNLKALWQEENKELEARIAVNERMIRKMNLDKTMGGVDVLVKRALIGRNLALVYFFISVVLAAQAHAAPAYSIPALLAGVAMLWSFFSHLPITRPGYGTLSVVALQKQICAFRMHTAANAVYDMAIVSGWLVTMLPLTLKVALGIAVYSDVGYTLQFLGVAVIIVALIVVFSRNVYKQYNEQLKDAELQLNAIAEFEGGRHD